MTVLRALKAKSLWPPLWISLWIGLEVAGGGAGSLHNNSDSYLESSYHRTQHPCDLLIDPT